MGRDFGHEKDYSEEVASEIDKEVRTFIEEAYTQTQALLSENLDKLHLIAEALLEKETLEGKEIEHLLQEGKLPEKIVEVEEETPIAPVPVETPETAVVENTAVVAAPADAEAEQKAVYPSTDKS